MQDRPPQNYLWNVLKSGQSYRNIAYLLASFPLGLLYFIMFAVGVSMGVGMAVIGIGIFILWGVFGLSGLLANFERWQANQLLQTQLPMQDGDKFNIRNSNNWRSVGYLALKFPLGLLTFIFTTFIIGTIIGMITMPLTYNGIGTTVIFAREIDTLWEALVSSVFGLVLMPFALILLGKMALLWRNLSLNLLRVDESLTMKRKNSTSREEIEEDVINRLIDKGLINEESLIEEKRKRLSYGE